MRLEALATHIPAGRLEVDAIIRDAGGDARESASFRGLFGMEAVAMDDDADGIVDHLDHLLGRLGPAIPAPQPDLFVYVHAQPARRDGGLPTVAALRARHPLLARLRHALEVDQHNCAGVLFALHSIERLFAAGFARSALIFAGDRFTDWRAGDRYVPGCTVLGDAFALMLVSDRPGGELRFGPVATRCEPQFSAGLDADAEAMRAFHRDHLDLIDRTLAPTGFAAAGETILFPHNINGLCWRLYARRTGLPEARVRTELVAGIGHCCTTDPLLLLDRHLRAAPAGRPFDGCLMSIGMGGFAGAVRLSQAAAPAPAREPAAGALCPA